MRLVRRAASPRPTSAVTLMLDVSWSSGILAPDHKYSTDFAHGYVVCLLEDDSVVEAIKFLSGDAIPKAVRALGKDHATVIELVVAVQRTRRFCGALQRTLHSPEFTH